MERYCPWLRKANCELTQSCDLWPEAWSAKIPTGFAASKGCSTELAVDD